MEKDILTLLNEKIDSLLHNYNEANKTIENLQMEVNNLKEQKLEIEAKNAQLEEDLALKDLELEEIVGKIESILGK